MTALVEAPTDAAAAVASARETVAALADTLWAAARPEDLLAVTEELQALRSTLAAVEARVAVEVEATEAARTVGWVSPADYLTHVAGGRHGHGSRTLRTARGLCGDRTSTLLALQTGDLSPSTPKSSSASSTDCPCHPRCATRPSGCSSGTPAP